MRSHGVDVVRKDLERAALPDARLRERAGKLGARICEHPERGLPRILDESELEGGYRLVNNPRVTHSTLLAGHRDASVERAAGLRQALAIHDTTAFVFGGDEPRDGLGLDNHGRGFSAHFGLLASADGERRPLGIVSMEPLFRYRRNDSERRALQRYRAADKESLRWIRMVDDIEEHCGKALELIHVMDSEADWYDLLEHLHRHQHRFIVRMTHERILLGTRGQRLTSTPSELLGRVAAIATREVALSRRTGKGKAPNSKKKHGPRQARIAQLEVAARSVVVARPTPSVAPNASITVNLVHVREVKPPAGCEPVEWLLATTEPVDSATDILTIVDHYRARWLIEEFFKSLKTGCAYEKRQFESKHALLNILAILVPVAWMLLALRISIKDESKAPASRLLTARQMLVLRAALRRRTKRDFLPNNPTESDIAYGIARLGGYINKARQPGWRVLGWGYQDLLTMEAGWALARGEA
jgi:hypothetical protein